MRTSPAELLPELGHLEKLLWTEHELGGEGKGGEVFPSGTAEQTCDEGFVSRGVLKLLMCAFSAYHSVGSGEKTSYQPRYCATAVCSASRTGIPPPPSPHSMLRKRNVLNQESRSSSERHNQL